MVTQPNTTTGPDREPTIYECLISGPLRRKLALQYLELTQRELEFVSLSRDTTESDLKQRREISSGTAFYIDQSAVRAASEGRILVLEGIEKVSSKYSYRLNNKLV